MTGDMQAIAAGPADLLLVVALLEISWRASFGFPATPATHTAEEAVAVDGRREARVAVAGLPGRTSLKASPGLRKINATGISTG